jgi:hypothetical protein
MSRAYDNVTKVTLPRALVVNADIKRLQRSSEVRHNGIDVGRLHGAIANVNNLVAAGLVKTDVQPAFGGRGLGAGGSRSKEPLAPFAHYELGRVAISEPNIGRGAVHNADSGKDVAFRSDECSEVLRFQLKLFAVLEVEQRTGLAFRKNPTGILVGNEFRLGVASRGCQHAPRGSPQNGTGVTAGVSFHSFGRGWSAAWRSLT